MKEDKGRNQTQDCLRGFIVILALLEHFSMILNSWYRDYFSINRIYSFFELPASVKLYEHHHVWLGKWLPVDSLYQTVGILFIPWLTHLFIALSGFNLARKSSADSRLSIVQALKLYALLFLIFLVEQLIVSPDFGWGIALFPITIWFVLLAITQSTYSFTGIKGVIGLFLMVNSINLFGKLGIVQLPSINQFMLSIHPWAKQSAEPLAYLGDCLLGLILGYTFIQLRLRPPILKSILIITGITTVLLYFNVNHLFKLEPKTVTLYDEILHQDYLGILFIYSISSFILALTQLMNATKVPAMFNLLKWVGLNSLGLFLIHRIFFIKILVPIRLHITSYWGWPVSNSSWELLFLYLPLTLFIYWGLKRSNFFGSALTRY